MARNVQITPAAEYEKGEGFVVERRYNHPAYEWALPDWTEAGFDGLEGVFPTREAAEQAIAEAFAL